MFSKEKGQVNRLFNNHVGILDQSVWIWFLVLRYWQIDRSRHLPYKTHDSKQITREQFDDTHSACDFLLNENISVLLKLRYCLKNRIPMQFSIANAYGYLYHASNDF